MEWAGQTYSSPPLRAVAWRSRTPTRVGCSNEFVAPRVRAVHLPAAHLARHVRARHLDGRGQVPIAVAVDQRDRDLAAGLVAAGDRVDHRERPQVRDVVHAPAARDRQRWALTAALLALAMLWLSPIAWVVVTSLKPSEDIIRLPPEWIPWPATGAQ